MNQSIVLVPLDERPVNTRYPEMLAAIGGATLLLPPVAIRGLQRTPADLDQLLPWLREASADARACIVSCDCLGYGNLINARISNDSAATVLGRLALLADVGLRVPVHAFSLVTRVANANESVEEPLYWADWGTQIYRWARLRHQSESKDLDDFDRATIAVLEKTIPHELRTDWLTRRLRNHTVNLALLEMAARGQIKSLLLTSDDTAPYGFPTRERDWLRSWPSLIGSPLSDRVRMYPGADEVGSALVARVINEASGRVPKVRIEYAIPGDEEIVAPYEDRPVRETVLGQIEACGCVVASDADGADFVLGVVTPSRRRTDYRSEYLELDREDHADAYRQFLQRLASSGLPIAIADVAYPNGSDPLFSELLLDAGCPVAPGRLAAYGAWNTAGNTLGVVVAQAALSTAGATSLSPPASGGKTTPLGPPASGGKTTPLGPPASGGNTDNVRAQGRFLAHRFLEDYGYQARVRPEARAESERMWGRRDPDPESEEEQEHLCTFIETRLAEVLVSLQAHGIGEGLSIVAGSVRLPWRRTFEVDFELA